MRRTSGCRLSAPKRASSLNRDVRWKEDNKMKLHNIGLILLAAPLFFCGCSTTKCLRPEDSPYNVLESIMVPELQDNHPFSKVIDTIEDELSTRYTNNPPFRFYVAPEIRSLKVHCRYERSSARTFLRDLKQDAGLDVSVKKQKVFINAAPASPPFDVYTLPTCDYFSKTATVFEVVNDINTRLNNQYGTNVPVVFSASRNISTNETVRFMVGTPSIKVFSDMVAHATLSNYRRTGNIVHFYNALADEDLIIEQSVPEYAAQSASSSEP